MRQNKRKALQSVICLVLLVFACASCLPEPAAPAAMVSAPYASGGTAPESVRTGYAPFDDAVFIGDCITVRLQNYVTEKRQTDKNYMGTARFLSSNGLGATNALKPVASDSKHPSYQGEKRTIEDSVASMGAKKVYIMLGHSDLHVYSADDTVKSLETLIGRIREKSPGITVFVQSATPVTKAGETKRVHNRALNVYNVMLRYMCEKTGCNYIDLVGVLSDEQGYLPEEYSSNNEAHPNEAFCELWIDYLLSYKV